jgi:translation initiation factor IF-2
MQIGRVTHYYDKIKVAVIEVLKTSLNIGDTVKFSGHDKEFIQTISSMQMEYKKVKKAKKGETVGVLVDTPVKSGDVVFLAKG